MATRKEVLEHHLSGWLAAKHNKKQRGRIVALIHASLGMNPKSVPRAFRRLQMKTAGTARGAGRLPVFGPDVNAALKTIWEAAHCPCGEILYPVIAEYVSILRRDGQWEHGESATKKLFAMKEHTVRRRATGLRQKYRIGSGISGTRPSHLKNIIPIFKGPWKDLSPGNGQLDTVAHCGESLAGDFIYTVNYTDAATYWIIPAAQWNKGETATVNNMETIKNRLPFPWLMGHPDSGSEFINWTAKGWFEREGIKLTRSEPNRKNDNMYVEERNGHVVRKYVGYVRFDERGVLEVLNELYVHLALYLNHFIPVRRTLSKERIGAKYVRIYEKKAMTPYKRVLVHSAITEEIKDRLQKEHARLNPLILGRKIDKLMKEILKIQRNRGTAA